MCKGLQVSSKFVRFEGDEQRAAIVRKVLQLEIDVQKQQLSTSVCSLRVMCKGPAIVSNFVRLEVDEQKANRPMCRELPVVTKFVFFLCDV